MHPNKVLSKIAEDNCICGKCWRRKAEKFEGPDWYRYYAVEYSPVNGAEKVVPTIGKAPEKHPEFSVNYDNDMSNNLNQNTVAVVNKPGLACHKECGLIDNWNGEGAYPFENRPLDSLIEAGHRIVDRLEEQDIEIDREVMIESLREGREEGKDDFPNWEDSTAEAYRAANEEE